MKQVNSMKNEPSKIEDYLSVFNKAKGNAEQVVHDNFYMIKKVGKSVDISKKIDTATSKVTEFSLGCYREEGQWFCQRGRGFDFRRRRGTGRRRRQDVFDFGSAALGVPTKDHEDHITRMLNPDHLESFFESIYEVKNTTPKRTCARPCWAAARLTGAWTSPSKTCSRQICWDWTTACAGRISQTVHSRRTA